MDISKYFDWAATAPQDKEILTEALTQSMELSGNPSAVHKEGQKARTAFENARKKAASVLGVKPEEVFFTSGGTESDHIPLLSLINREPDREGHRGTVILSGIEHPALREQADRLKKTGFNIVTVNPDTNGFVTAESILTKLTPDTVFVTVMAVNNETGCVQNIYQIADGLIQACQGKRKPHLHIDCVQAAGKIPLNLNYRGIDSAALSAHKISGPRGTGILVLKKDIKPFLTGGGQEKNIRSGTENLFGAIAFSNCLEKYYFPEISKLNQNQKNIISKHRQMSVNFIEGLKTIKNCTLVPELRGNTDSVVQENFSPYVIQAAFKGIPGNVMVRALDAKGFSISTGSACSAKKQSRPILAAMNATREIQDTAVRFSFGHFTTEKDLEALLEAVKSICKDFC